MKVIWSKAPCPANEVIETLRAADPKWHPKTIKTYLTRLVGKKALDFHREGRAYVYVPLVGEKECVDAASESFLSRVFGGSLKPMLAHFVQHKRLSREELLELRRLLETEGEE
jgi:BlaI family penicillinase repressor